MQLIAASKIFTGEHWLHNHVVGVEEGKIISVEPFTGKDQQNLRFYKDQILVPAFLDVQVYGAAGKLFSVFPEASTLSLMHEVFSKEGTVVFQPTVATNSFSVFRKCIDAVRSYWSQGGKGVHGLHLEGPWINPVKRGAHVQEYIVQPDTGSVTELLDYGKDVITMITLAPEKCSEEIIRLIQSRGIVISAGHSTANYQQAMDGFDKGITAVTHLFNAMSPLHHREPGLPAATMLHKSVKASIIPDGHHVDYAMIS
ncbi:MAG: N-acetylglucosamine-6-phosphate deacetylase, partial [Flavisolibacter sp.]